MEPLEDINGTLVMVGGGTTPADVRDDFVKRAGGANAKLVVIPTATAAADKADAEGSLEPWKKYKLASLTLLHTRDRRKADDPAFVKPLTEATAVWFGGGDQSNITAAYLGTAVEAELKKLLARNGVIGGTSAGAAIMTELMITGGAKEAKTGRGMGFLTHCVVDQHFLKRDRTERLIGVLKNNLGLFGIGIDEGTAAIIKGRTLTVKGTSYVVTILPEGGGRKLTQTKLKSGEKADMIALSRAAIERANGVWPPLQPPVPNVPKGTLVIGGGGGMPKEVWKRFIEAAGGPKANIVFVPTAGDDPVPKEPGEMKSIRKEGPASIKILHTRKRAEANSDAFLADLKKATGVWFTGGRQWKLVDAYQGTRAEKEMHAVLERGGVIGGSSAGASIQNDFMLRGDPFSNVKPMFEGYERGLSFIQGVAIDQHFFKRKRLPDMTNVMAAHPQLLGIGLDEQTAIVVKGEIMEVIGNSKIAIYNRQLSVVAGQPDYEVLTPGMRYDMKARKLIKAN